MVSHRRSQCRRTRILAFALLVVCAGGRCALAEASVPASATLIDEWTVRVESGAQVVLATGRRYFDQVTGREYTVYVSESGAPLPSALTAGLKDSRAGVADSVDAAIKPASKAGARAKALPRSVRAGIPSAGRSVSAPVPDPARIEETSTALESQRKGVLQIGLREPMNETVLVSAGPKGGAAAWTPLADGSLLWTLEITAPDAKAIRVHLEDVALPAGCSITAWNADDSSESVGPYTAAALYEGGDFWTESLFTPRVMLECHVPAGADDAGVAFVVKEIVYTYVDVRAEVLRKVGNCHNDPTCFPAWRLEEQAVAGIGSIGEVGETWCTGCLLNDNDPSTYIDYFMTANHCVGSQGEASTLEFYWFYQTATCNGTAPSPSAVPRTGGGADYLAGRNDWWGNDFSFLRLRQESPGGVGFAGWTAEAAPAGEATAGIHHPDGSYKRISFGNVTGSDSEFVQVRWNSGVTEPGSSGSPLFNSNRRFIGQLWGGESSCSDPSGIDDYGRFDVSYPYVRQWLSPASSSGYWYIRSLIPNAPPIYFGESWGDSSMLPVPGDYDGDGVSDLAMFQPSSGNWYIRSLIPDSPPIVFGMNWGDSSMVPVEGDYSGDGISDLAMFQPFTGNWYIRTLVPNSAPIVFGMNWGNANMTAVPGDYNGDGLADLAMYWPATGQWFIRTLVPNSAPIVFGMQWGGAGLAPVPGDYNGDGLADLAVHQTSTGYWFIRTLVPNSVPIVFGMNWGAGGEAVPGDYNGDAVHDLSVFYPSTGNWYIRTLIPNSTPIVFGMNWGAGADPVPGDYNGDGLSDLAVFH